jgi:hypothetical protein
MKRFFVAGLKTVLAGAAFAISAITVAGAYERYSISTLQAETSSPAARKLNVHKRLLTVLQSPARTQNDAFMVVAQRSLGQLKEHEDSG